MEKTIKRICSPLWLYALVEKEGKKNGNKRGKNLTIPKGLWGGKMNFKDMVYFNTVAETYGKFTIRIKKRNVVIVAFLINLATPFTFWLFLLIKFFMKSDLIWRF